MWILHVGGGGGGHYRRNGVNININERHVC